MLERLKKQIEPIYFVREPLLRYPILGGLLIALFASESILNDIPALKLFTQFMSTIFPPIQYYAAKSKFPQVTELYFAFMWLFAPLHFYFLNADFQSQRFRWAMKWKQREFDQPYRGFWQFAHRILFIGVLIPGLIVFFFFYNNGYDFNLLPINSSRIALGLFGFWFAGAMGFVLLQYEYHQMKKLLSELRLKFTKGA